MTNNQSSSDAACNQEISDITNTLSTARRPNDQAVVGSDGSDFFNVPLNAKTQLPTGFEAESELEMQENNTHSSNEAQVQNVIPLKKIPSFLEPHAHRCMTPERQAELLEDYEITLRQEAKDPEFGLSEKRIKDLLKKAKGFLSWLPVPESTGDLWPRSSGKTGIKANGDTYQKLDSIANEWFDNGDSYKGWFSKQSSIGVKGDGECVYDALFVERGHPNKWNCVAICTITIDLDSKIIDGVLVAALENQEEVAKMDAWAAKKGGHLLHTTSSNNPLGNGRICRKYQFICEPISYIERVAFGHLMRKEIADVLGIEEGSSRWAMIDRIISAGVQVQYAPRWKDKFHQDQSELMLVDGPPLDFSGYRKIILEKEIQETKIRQEKQAALKTFRSTFQDVELSDRELRAQRVLAKMGPAVEGKQGHDHTFLACIVGRKCGLSLEFFLPILFRWNATCSPPWDEHKLELRAEKAYIAFHGEEYHFSSSQRAARFDPFSNVSGLVSLDFSGTSTPVAPVKVGQKGISSVTREVVVPLSPFNTEICDPLKSGTSTKDGTDQRVPEFPGLPKLTKYTRLHTPSLPPLHRGDLSHKLTVYDSPCGTGKTKAYIGNAREALLARERVLIHVPTQSLSRSLAKKISEGLPKELQIQSHLDEGCDWSKSLVTCYHSAWKVKLFTEENTGIKVIDFGDLEDLEEKPNVIAHPVELLIMDEAGEINDCRTNKMVRDAHRCDSNHKAVQDICAMSKNVIALQAHIEIDDLAMLTQDFMGWVGDKESEADWHFVYNDFNVMAPDIFVGANPERLRKQMLNSWRRGERLNVACSTVMLSEMEAIKFLVTAMSERAGFDVQPFCGPSGRNANETASDLPELVEEMKKRGLKLESVRPKVLIVNADRHDDEVVDFLEDPNSNVLNYDAIFYTATIQSGFSIEVPMAVFGFFQAGVGPVATGLHQMMFRCRMPIGNRIQLIIAGKNENGSKDPAWQYQKLIRWGKDNHENLDGITTYRTIRATDGTPYLTEFNEVLVMAEAKRLARHYQRADIVDTRDDFGKVISWGALTGFWNDIGLNVIPMYEQEMEEYLEKSIEEIKKSKEEEKTLRHDVREGQQEKVVAAPKMKKEITDKMKKDRRRSPEKVAQIESSKIRHRYHLETLTLEDLEWDRLNAEKVFEFSQIEAVKQDKEKVIKAEAEWEGPILVHQRHRAAKAIAALGWLDLMGLGDLDEAVANEVVIQDLGALLRNKPLEKMKMKQDWGIDLDKDTGLAQTLAFLRKLGLKTKQKQIPQGDGTRKKGRILKAEQLLLMREKSKAIIQRILDPEKSKEEWAKIEESTCVKDPILEKRMAEQVELQTRLEALNWFEEEIAA